MTVETVIVETSEEWADTIFWKNRTIKKAMQKMKVGKIYEVTDPRAEHTVRKALYWMAEHLGVKVETCKSGAGKILVRRIE